MAFHDDPPYSSAYDRIVIRTFPNSTNKLMPINRKLIYSYKIVLCYKY